MVLSCRQDVLRLRLFKIPCRYLLVFAAVAMAFVMHEREVNPPEIFNGEAWLRPK
jgi:hypothetical protein